MRIAHVTRRPRSGSRYKYEMMFRRVHDLDVVESGSKLTGYDVAIVEGDKCRDYQQAIRAGIPYVLIQHDTASIRFDVAEDQTERQMVENAACVLFTSETHAAWMEERYTLPPWRIVHLRPFAADLDFEPLAKVERSVVYAGGIVPLANRDKGFGYRAYHPIFARLIDAGWQVHIYPAWNGADTDGSFHALGCVVHDEVPQRALYRELSQYTVGFQGYAETGPQCYVKGCRPNKLWEYLAAGIPTVGYNTGDGAKVYAGRWGTVAKTLDSLPAAAARAARIDVTPYRASEVIDGDIDVFRELIDMAAAAEKPRIVPEVVKLSRHLKPFTFDGRTYSPGDRVAYTVALAMRDAGCIVGRGL